MANDHYTRAYDPQPTQRVGSTDLKNEFQAVEAGFDSVQADTSRTLRQVGGAEIAPMPNAISRALKLLSFDAAGNPVMVSGGGRYRGDWVTATEYIVSDYFRDPITKNIYSTLIGHTSGVLATDISSGKVQLAINVADVEAAKTAAEAAATVATTQAGLATTNGAAQVALAADQVALATTQAGIATTQASTATTQAGIATAGASTATTQSGIATAAASWASDQADIATTQAGIATTKAAEAAASAASISSGPVTSVNTKTGVVTLVPADIGLETASQAEMEAGTEPALRAMSPLRVAQAIASLGKGKITRSARTSNTALAAADIGQLIDITSGTFTQTFVACATLGSGWFVYIRNAGTGNITLDPNASETIDGASTYVMSPGQLIIVHCDGTALRVLNISASNVLFIRDEKTSGTAGGAATASTWVDRTLNTVVVNRIPGASLASNTITLPAGTYEFSARCPANGVGATKAELRNTSDSTSIYGSSVRAGVSQAVWAFVSGEFTITASKNFKVRQWAQGTTDSNDFGYPSSISGVAEVYTDILIRKIL